MFSTARSIVDRVFNLFETATEKQSFFIGNFCPLHI